MKVHKVRKSPYWKRLHKLTRFRIGMIKVRLAFRTMKKRKLINPIGDE